MSTPVIESPVEVYLAAVEPALADLPATDRKELLDDVREHLAEVAAETGGPLEATLGSPVTYANELRSAAGLPPAETALIPKPGVTLRSRVAGHPMTRSASVFIRTLRPGWWVLRGAILATGILILLAAGRDADRLIHPRAPFIGLLVVVAAMAAAGSALAGRRTSKAGIAWRVVAVATNLVALGLLVATVVQVRDDARRYLQMHQRYVYVTEGTSSPTPSHPGSLTGPNGLVYNIYARDSLGNPLTGVQLFDQNGQPLNVEVGQDANGSPIVRRLPVDTGGHAVYNVFPQDQTVSNGVGIAAPAISASPVAVGSIAVVPPGPGVPQPVIVGLSTVPPAASASPAAAPSASPAPPSATPSK